MQCAKIVERIVAEAFRRIIVTDVLHHFARDLTGIDPIPVFAGDLPEVDDEVRADRRFARYTRGGIICQTGIQNRVRYLVAHFVRMAL